MPCTTTRIPKPTQMPVFVCGRALILGMIFRKAET